MGQGLVAFALDGITHRMIFWNYAQGTYAQLPFGFENGEANNIQVKYRPNKTNPRSMMTDCVPALAL